jgi:hypothetical protein
LNLKLFAKNYWNFKSNVGVKDLEFKLLKKENINIIGNILHKSAQIPHKSYMGVYLKGFSNSSTVLNENKNIGIKQSNITLNNNIEDLFVEYLKIENFNRNINYTVKKEILSKNNGLTIKRKLENQIIFEFNESNNKHAKYAEFFKKNID